MEYFLLFIYTFIATYGLDGIIKRRIHIQGYFIHKTIKGSPAIIVGMLTLVFGLYLLFRNLNLFLNPETSASTFITFLLSIISSLLIIKWFYSYNQSTTSRNTRTPIFLLGIFLLSAVALFVIAVLTRL